MRDIARRVAKWLFRENTPLRSRERFFVLILQMFLLFILLAPSTAVESLIELLRCGAHYSSWISSYVVYGGFIK